MNPFTTIWFWLLLLCIAGFIATFILYETSSQESTGSNETSSWIWILFMVSCILFVVSFILYYACVCITIGKCTEKIVYVREDGTILDNKCNKTVNMTNDIPNQSYITNIEPKLSFDGK